MELNALLLHEAEASRRYLAAFISNFPTAFEGSLCDKVCFDKMEATPDILKRFQRTKSVAAIIIAVLMGRVEQLRQVQIFNPITQPFNKTWVSVHDLLRAERPSEKKTLASMPYIVVH